MAEGLAMEFEELGMVALIGLLLVPGVLWIAKARSGASMAGRTVAVACLIGAAVTLEASLDSTAAPVTDLLEGKG